MGLEELQLSLLEVDIELRNLCKTQPSAEP